MNTAISPLSSCTSSCTAVLPTICVAISFSSLVSIACITIRVAIITTLVAAIAIGSVTLITIVLTEEPCGE
ncbi:MAG: hypothetical protein WC112_09535 [Proteiniphilum sp.]